MESRRAFLRTTAVSLAAGGLLLGTESALAAPAPLAAAAKVVSERRLSARLRELTVWSPAMATNIKVRLLVPKGWSHGATRTWPVLWLLHGGHDDYRGWTTHSDIEKLSANWPVLVVMPEGGFAGGYTDWWNFGAGGGYRWETFHLAELRTLLELGYHASGRRAVAGNSTGGFGALIYAARHPGMFRYAAGFSPFASTLSKGVPQVLMTGLNGLRPKVDPKAMWGDPLFQEAVWAAHDPVTQAHHLRGTGLFVAAPRHGMKGPLDPKNAQAVDPAEEFIWYTVQPFLKRLKALKIPVTTHIYDRGTHTWPYFRDDLHRAWKPLMHSLGLA